MSRIPPRKRAEGKTDTTEYIRLYENEGSLPAATAYREKGSNVFKHVFTSDEFSKTHNNGYTLRFGILMKDNKPVAQFPFDPPVVLNTAGDSISIDTKNINPTMFRVTRRTGAVGVQQDVFTRDVPATLLQPITKAL